VSRKTGSVNIPGEGEPTATPDVRRNIDSSAHITHAGSTIRSRARSTDIERLTRTLASWRRLAAEASPTPPVAAGHGSYCRVVNATLLAAQRCCQTSERLRDRWPR
jgi:hypothetical protein